MSAGGSSEALQAPRDPKRHVGPDLWPSVDPDEVVLDVLDDEVCIRLVRNAERGVDRPLQGWPVYLARSDLVPVGRKEEIEAEDVTWLGLMPLCESADLLPYRGGRQVGLGLDHAQADRTAEVGPGDLEGVLGVRLARRELDLRVQMSVRTIDVEPVSYTHLTLPTSTLCRSRWS